MTRQEHLDQIQHKLDYVAMLQASHDEKIGKLTDDIAEFGQNLKTMAENEGLKESERTGPPTRLTMPGRLVVCLRASYAEPTGSAAK